MFKFFEYEYGRTFTHHKAVARLTEGAACAFGIVVAGRQSVHAVEAAHTGGIDSRFSTTGEDNVGFAKAYEVERVDKRVVR